MWVTSFSSGKSRTFDCDNRTRGIQSQPEHEAFPPPYDVGRWRFQWYGLIDDAFGMDLDAPTNSRAGTTGSNRGDYPPCSIDTFGQTAIFH